MIGSIRVNDAKNHHGDDPDREGEAHRMIQESIDWAGAGGTLVNINFHPRDQTIRCGGCRTMEENATNGTYCQTDPSELQEPQMGGTHAHE